MFTIWEVTLYVGFPNKTWEPKHFCFDTLLACDAQHYARLECEKNLKEYNQEYSFIGLLNISKAEKEDGYRLEKQEREEEKAG